jgi:hypothetical protein
MIRCGGPGLAGLATGAALLRPIARAPWRRAKLGEHAAVRGRIDCDSDVVSLPAGAKPLHHTGATSPPFAASASGWGEEGALKDDIFDHPVVGDARQVIISAPRTGPRSLTWCHVSTGCQDHQDGREAGGSSSWPATPRTPRHGGADLCFTLVGLEAAGVTGRGVRRAAAIQGLRIDEKESRKK